ncbi:uncharacterized protein LOC117330345 [Pecten maximus]|uniref:uncharacterized protein LOC117330345 n=1 Tax=Pecten maximus TaxID=6579 RepID=UPI001457F073|nr:uncharacterized protein LOC117330345 [Pecten maximus]
MKGGTICFLLLVVACTLVQGKRMKQRHIRAAEEIKELQINHDLVRTKRKLSDPALTRMKRLQEPPEPYLDRTKRTRRSLRAKYPHIKERPLHRMKRVPKEAVLHRTKRVPKEAVLHRAKRVRAEKTLKRIKRLRRDLRTQLMRHRRNTFSSTHPLKIPIMKRAHKHRMMRPRPDNRNQARLNRMKAAIGNHIQQRKRNHFMRHKVNGPTHKKNDVMRKKNEVAHKKMITKKKKQHTKSDKKHHVQVHAN